MRYTLRTIFALCMALSAIAYGGIRQNQRAPKHLPLDGLSGVVLKSPATNACLPGRIIVKLMPAATTSLSKSAFGISSVDRILSRAMGIEKAQMFPTAAGPQHPGEVDLSLMYVISYSSPNDPAALAMELSQIPEVQYAEPWYISSYHKTTSTPNDLLYGSQWGLTQVHASAAWDITPGDSTVVIAIVDCGVEISHPDLAANIWHNQGEMGTDALGRDKRFNGVDDDSNGYVDDWQGWDLVGANYATYDPTTTKGDNDPSPKGINNDHGTHVAGIASATSNNAIGVASIAPNCRILAVKCSADDDTRDNGSSYVLSGYQGIVYAALMKASVINCSWGGYGGSQAEQDMVDYATQRGSLIVGAAGNDNVDGFQTPASYRGVLSVASTGRTDIKSSWSNYGDNVDVCSPGESILSTIYPSTYAYMSGTSMSTPLVSGLAALVKSKFPSYTALQVGERVRVTCDNIDALNPGYAGALGRGRINALRALQDPPTSSVRLQSFAFNDFPGGNGNSVPEPAETLNVVCNFKNFLQPTSGGATVQITSTDTRYVTVIQGITSIGSLGTFDSTTNTTNPFRVYVQRGVPQSYTARLQLTYQDGSFTDIQYIKFLVNPTYATHNVNAIQLTLTNNGRIGYYDFPDNLLGKGFIFNGGNTLLFEGGLIVGTSGTQVVDVVRNEGGLGQDADFRSNGFYTLQSPGLLSDQDGATVFNDSLASINDKIGLEITMHSYAFSDPTDSKYVILQYNLKNTTRSYVANLFAGLFLDWDLGNYEADYSAYDASRGLGYCYDSGIGTLTNRAYVGVVALSGASGFRSLVRDSTDLTRPSKWDWISGGFKRTQAGPTDIHQVISSGPYAIAPGATRVVAFALVAGDSSLANIRQNADAARARWQALATTVGVGNNGSGIPETYQLSQNYPNPFNPSTTFEIRIAQTGLVNLAVFDVLGRKIATLVNEVRQPGSYTVHWDASSLPSGVYFYRLHAGNFTETKKMILAK